MKTDSSSPAQTPQYFKYSPSDIEWLKKDPRMAALIEAVGPVRRQIYPDLFQGLVRTIMGQQISSRVHNVLWKRYLDKFEAASPGEIAALPVEEIKNIGLSSRKAQYISKIAAIYAAGHLNKRELAEMGDYSLTQKLTSLPGIGPWSAEMLLIFTFQRENVISYHDLGIQRALIKLYALKRMTFTRFIDCSRRYSPVSTLASFYLWELAGGQIDINL